MELIVQQATIIDSGHSLNGQKKDILISNGIITEISEHIKSNSDTKIVSSPHLHVSAGWCDMSAQLREPGYEFKEDIHSGLAAAASGGFTAVSVMPDTLPVVQTKSEIQFILNKAKENVVSVLPVGALSKNLEGKVLAELYDMYLHGAVAFSDGKRSLTDAGLLLRALLYAKSFGGKVMTWCNDKYIALDGKVNEGKISTHIGIKGIPSLAEDLIVSRNIAIAAYCDSPLHIHAVSTRESVQLIREAKAKGLKITADVTAHHLLLDDSNIETFDTNYKVLPPLRNREHMEALIEGLADGTIDAICSDHCPEDTESKNKEFDHAAFGIIGLETAFAAAFTSLQKNMSIETIIDKLSTSPRKILNTELPEIKIGAKANLTLFDPEINWTFQNSDIKSKSKNTPFVGFNFKGKAIGIYNNNKLVLN